jgi:tRNA-splicing ligase RtcB
MATPGWVVAGQGLAASLRSASHGAGRAMSRAQARKRLHASAVRRELAAAGVEILGADLDEAPAAYKDIGQVMQAQADLVTTLARFDPVLVRMAGRRLAT